MSPSDALLSLVQAHPMLVDIIACVYLVGAFFGHIFRSGWPDENSRPRWVIIVILIADACQGVFFGPVKAMARKL